MTRNEKYNIKRDMELREFWNSISAAIMANKIETIPRLSAVVVYLIGAVYVASKSKALAASADNIELLSPVVELIMRHSVRAYLLIVGIALLILMFYPLGRKWTEEALKFIGLPRYILACDEIAEVLDKTGLTKEKKELVGQIESRLSMIARQGRAFGIHLIFATQRPDANILSGQIRNNINCRVCGRADNVLSQIILDNTDAADQIPKDAKGRFMLHDGTVFQGYWLDEVKL